MCLFPKLIKNPKYIPNKKNGYSAPPITDQRTLYVPIGCGNCIECRKKKSKEWQTRLQEEYKEFGKIMHFVTLTFSEESLIKLCDEFKMTESNYIATKAVRRWLERYRKKHKKSIKHFLITELGTEDGHSERIHLHGIIWSNDIDETLSHWKYGKTDIGDYCNERTINYIVKYITKIDQKHKNYKSIILSSPGIGRIFIEKPFSLQCKYNGKDTQEYIRNSKGSKMQLPIYYRNYLYTEKEREKLWLNKLDKQERFILGKKYNYKTEEDIKKFNRILKNVQKWNNNIGYGDDTNEWKEKDYNVSVNIINKLTKLKKYQKEKNKLFNKL